MILASYLKTDQWCYCKFLIRFNSTDLLNSTHYLSLKNVRFILKSILLYDLNMIFLLRHLNLFANVSYWCKNRIVSQRGNTLRKRTLSICPPCSSRTCLLMSTWLVPVNLHAPHARRDWGWAKRCFFSWSSRSKRLLQSEQLNGRLWTIRCWMRFERAANLNLYT